MSKIGALDDRANCRRRADRPACGMPACRVGGDRLGGGQRHSPFELPREAEPGEDLAMWLTGIEGMGALRNVPAAARVGSARGGDDGGEGMETL